MSKFEKKINKFAYDTLESAIEKSNKKGIKYLRWEIENGIIDEETFNIKLYGTRDKNKINKIRQKFLK